MGFLTFREAGASHVSPGKTSVPTRKEVDAGRRLCKCKSMEEAGSHQANRTTDHTYP